MRNDSETMPNNCNALRKNEHLSQKADVKIPNELEKTTKVDNIPVVCNNIDDHGCTVEGFYQMIKFLTEGQSNDAMQ